MNQQKRYLKNLILIKHGISVLIFGIFLTSCEPDVIGGGSGGYGEVASSDYVNDYLNRTMSPAQYCYSKLGADEYQSIEPPVPTFVTKGKAWPYKYSEHLFNTIKNDKEAQVLIDGSVHINDRDLKYLGCPNFNNLNKGQKIVFWTQLLSSMSLAENGYIDARLDYKGNLGLLQIDQASAYRHNCQPPKNLRNPLINLSCGIKIMSHQIRGGSTRINQRLRGRIFPSPAYYWGVLQKFDNRHPVIVKSFRNHITQMPYCDPNRARLIAQKPNLGEQVNDQIDCSAIFDNQNNNQSEKVFQNKIFNNTRGSSGTIDQ